MRFMPTIIRPSVVSASAVGHLQKVPDVPEVVVGGGVSKGPGFFPSVRRRLPEILAGFGVDVITEDAVPVEVGQALDNPLYNTPWLAWHNAGWCNERSGDSERAEGDYRSALQLNPRFAPSLLAMARVSVESGNYLSARAYLQRYAEVADHTAESLWLGVRTENQLGDSDQLASYRLKLLARFPDSDEAKYLESIE